MVQKGTISKTDKSIADAIDTAGQAGSNEICLSTGVILIAKQANPNVLIRVMTDAQRPEPPTWFNKAMGREMENPDDPDYIKRVQAWEMGYNNSMLNALIGLGTELKSKPKGFPGPDDDTWLEDYKAFGLQTHPESKAWRYITWILFKAAVIDKDTQAISDKVKQLSGVREADVKSAETFPGSDKEDR
jgi:hypothetical protein